MWKTFPIRTMVASDATKETKPKRQQNQNQKFREGVEGLGEEAQPGACDQALRIPRGQGGMGWGQNIPASLGWKAF